MTPISTSILSVIVGSIGVAALATPLVARDDYVCDPETMDTTNNVFTCYVEKSAMNIVGAPQFVSPVTSCSVDECDSGVSSTYTVEQSFSFDVGIDGGAGKGSFEGGASLGASWEWSSSQATSTTTSFKLGKGDAGRIVFFPYLHQSCGALVVADPDCTNDGTPCTPGTASVNDPNACGTTPMLLPENSGTRAADGVIQFCFTAGERNGEGCTSAPGPSQ